MIRVISWNIAKGIEPWHWLAKMAERGEADIALLQEAGSPPDDLGYPVRYEDNIFWDRSLYDRWPLVVQLSERVQVEWFRQVPPRSELDEKEIGVSGIGTMATAKVTPPDRPQEAFVVVSMYARWIKFHPSTGYQTNVGASDVSAHRILSDLSTFICDDRNWSKHRVLAAGDLNMFYGATGRRLSMPIRERTVWDRFAALGLEFLGPQAPHGRQTVEAPPDVSTDTKNVPTHFNKGTESAASAQRQLDYVFASRGFHETIRVRALNGVSEWGPSDHCRLLIEVAAG